MNGDAIYDCALGYALLFKPKFAWELVGKFGSAKEVFKLSGKELAPLLGGNVELANVIKGGELLDWAKEEVEWANSKGIKIVTPFTGEYPPLLKECADAPYLLYYKGSIDLLREKSISVVGTRLASSYGRECCSTIIEHIKDYNPVIISGLAYGIDIAAHKAALDKGLDTIAVLPNGLDTIYPSAHREIAKKIVKQGGVLTEFPRGMPARKLNFIKRNRIIAGMSQGVIVIESRIKGGAMSTVEFANSYGREVFALPGRFGDVNSYGCNYLISKSIASIYCNELVVPSTLGWKGGYSDFVSLQPDLFYGSLEDKEKILLSLKVNLPTTVEEIVSKCAMSFDNVAYILLELELEGAIISLGGRGYCLKS